MAATQSASREWLPISATPAEGELEIGIIDYDGLVVALPYPCHKSGTEFVDASNKKHVDIQPTHWRKWSAPR